MGGDYSAYASALALTVHADAAHGGGTTPATAVEPLLETLSVIRGGRPKRRRKPRPARRVLGSTGRATCVSAYRNTNDPANPQRQHRFFAVPKLTIGSEYPHYRTTFQGVATPRAFAATRRRPAWL